MLDDSRSSLNTSAYFHHALANPITHAYLNCELALAELAQLPESHPSLQYLKDGLNHLTYVKKLLSPHQDAQSVPVLPLVKEVVTRQHQPHLQQEIFWHHALQTHHRVVTNACLFQEVLSCVIHNGFEAYAPTRCKRLSLLCWPSKTQVFIQIWDQGQGISSWQKLWVTWPGWSFKPGHTGLGLALVRKTVKDHGGQLELRSQAKWGTTITLAWPLEI